MERNIAGSKGLEGMAKEQLEDKLGYFGNATPCPGSLICDTVAMDLLHVWHPFTQAATSPPPIAITRGEGVYLYDEEGTAYLDATSSWWTNLHGHCHPHIVEAISNQAQALEHVMFAGLTHQPACKLAQNLLQLIPSNLKRVFFSDNGSTAVEAALKIALQYWYNRDPDRPRKKIIAFRHGYHGDTVGAMSVSDRNHFSSPFSSLLFDVTFIDPPAVGKEEHSLEQLCKALDGPPAACFIFEPLLQGVGGFRVHTSEGLSALIALCQERGIITIADEVLTGFGRTGPLFSSTALQNKPDIICLAKGLTGGFLPLAITACSEGLFEGFLAPERHKAFLHGHTYSANPIGCAAALANLELLNTPLCEQQRDNIEKQHRNFQMKWENHPKLLRCETIGTILLVEYRDDASSSYYSTLRDKLLDHFLNKHVLLRPFGNCVHVIPPYCITVEQLEIIYDALSGALEVIP